MSHSEIAKAPAFFQWLAGKNDICSEDIQYTEDNFFCICKSVSSILGAVGITSLPDRDETTLECRYYFDDWFLYAVSHGEVTTYSLFKMREQEHDREMGVSADGDTPGVTVSFIAFDTEAMKRCLEDPSETHRKNLAIALNAAAASRNQTHHAALKAYFVRPEAQAPYLIAELYINCMVSLSSGNEMNVPDAYKTVYKKWLTTKRFGRIPTFLEENNRQAGRTVCNHEKIYIQNRNHLSRFEKLAILATHTGNVSFHSFAAEVRFHAMFLTKLAAVHIPLLGSPYESAVRADMSIHDREFQGPAPYYNLTGRLVKQQEKYHMDK